MTKIHQLASYLQELAPLQLAEDWDNVGLLIGEANGPVQRVMTCLTLTAESVAEAVDENANVVVTHHPLPFRPLKRITGETPEGRMLLQLIGAGIAVYSAHTAFDSATGGINQQLADALNLQNVRPLVSTDTSLPEPCEPQQPSGTGRLGECAAGSSIGTLIEQTKSFLKISNLQWVGKSKQPISRVAIACGSAGELLESAHQQGADLFFTGEVRFHTALQAEALGISLILCGHYASERFAQQWLASIIAKQFPSLKVWASSRERDPIHWA